MSEELTGAAEAAAPTNDVAPAPVAQEAPASPAEPAEPSLDDVLSAAYDKATSEPARGPDGKFVGKEPEAVEPESAAPAEAKVEDQTSPAVEQAEPAKPAIDPPAAWSREVREKWAAIPPDVQEYIARRETEAHGQISRLGQQVKAFEPVGKVLEQFRGVFERNQLNYADGVQRVLAVQQWLDNDPYTAIQNIAKVYGVDLGASTSDPNAPSLEVQGLKSQIADLQRQIAETRTDVRSTREKEEQARLAALESEVETFAKANTHFRDVEAEVVQIIPVLRAQEPGLSERQLLEKAYQKAIRLNDAVWAKVEADRKAKEAKEAAEKAAKAQKVATLNVKSNTAARPAARSIEDDLAATYDRIQSRAS